MPAKYAMPEALKQQIDEAAFARWLHRKALAHVRRDRARGFRDVLASAYKARIHEAVCHASGCDYYTGKPLDWHLISKWNNDEACITRAEYRRKFWNLPTIDHEDAFNPRSPFRLCSWRVNDAKNDQTIDELLKLADEIRAHRNRA